MYKSFWMEKLLLFSILSVAYAMQLLFCIKNISGK